MLRVTLKWLQWTGLLLATITCLWASLVRLAQQPTPNPLYPYRSIYPGNPAQNLWSVPNMQSAFNYGVITYYTARKPDDWVRFIAATVDGNKIVGVYFGMSETPLGDWVARWRQPQSVKANSLLRWFLWDCGAKALTYDTQGGSWARSLFTPIRGVSLRISDDDTFKCEERS